MICKELDKEFTDKADMFKALKENKEDIINIKRSSIQKSCDKGSSVSAKSIDISKLGMTSKGIITDDNYYYIAVNTTNILDSHNDLHKDGIWNKTAKEQQGKNYLVTDHKMELANVVGKKADIKMFVATIPFSVLGKSYTGDTQALIYKIHKDKVLNGIGKEWLESGDEIEASVRMQYVNIDLAMNSTEEGDESELKNYNDNINTIANKADFDSIDYFWIVTEAKNIGESSLVLMGSNDATGVVNDNKSTQPSNDTDKNEPSNDTQTNPKDLNEKAKIEMLKKFI